MRALPDVKLLHPEGVIAGDSEQQLEWRVAASIGIEMQNQASSLDRCCLRCVGTLSLESLLRAPAASLGFFDEVSNFHQEVGPLQDV